MTTTVTVTKAAAEAKKSEVNQILGHKKCNFWDIQKSKSIYGYKKLIVGPRKYN
jgi:hypothetical protein